MRKLIFIVLLSTISMIVNSQSWIYRNNLQGSGDIQTSNSVADSSGNIYIFGSFNDILSPTGFPQMTAVSKDMYLSKYDRYGNLKWIKQYGKESLEFSSDIILDYNNDLVITGFFMDTCKFDDIKYKSTGAFDVFVTKIDTSGMVLWSKNVAFAPSVQAAYKLDVDFNNNIIVAGLFKDSVIFGDSINAVNSQIFYGDATYDQYLLKLDNNGRYISAKTFVTNDASSRISDVHFCDNNYYATFYYKDSIYIQNKGFKSTDANLDGIIVKFDSNLDTIYTREFKGVDDVLPKRIISDKYNNIYIAGNYESDTLFIDSSATDVIWMKNVLGGNDIIYPVEIGQKLTINPAKTNGGSDIFLLKYDESGLLKWNISNGSINTDVIQNLSINDELIVLSGNYSDSLFFPNYSNRVDTLTNEGDRDAFCAIYNLDSMYNFSFSASGAAYDNNNATIIDKDNNLLFIGDYKSSNLDIDGEILNNAGNSDVFLAKYGCRGGIYPQFAIDSITCPSSSDGSASVFMTNGTDSIADNWTYLWSNADTDSLIENLSEDTYTVTITSPKGCQYTDSVFVTNKPVLQAILTIDTLTLNCLASNNGIAAVIPSHGYITGDTLTSDYHYLWSDGVSDSLRTDLEVGQYFVTVQDLCGAITEVVDSINIGHIPTLQANIQTQNVIVLCDTSSNGIGRVDYSDGVAPYSFYWENSNTDTTSAVANDLTVGWHTVTITDFCNVPIIDSVNIVNMPSLSTQITFSQNATCVGNLDGVATISPFNGVEPFIYTWSASVSDTSTANDLPGDSMIYITVSDICRDVVDSVYIEINPALEISFTNITNTNCSNSNDGSAEVSLTNEQGTVTYLWSNDSTTAINTALSVGYAIVSVTDICGEIVDSVEIQSELPLAAGTVKTDNNCYSDSLGTATISTLNEYGTVIYTWSTGDTTAIIDSLASGTYYYTVTDECNDIISDSVKIESPTAITDTVIIVNETLYGNADGSATLTVSGGTSPYIIAWSNNDIGNVAEYLTAGTYTYVIRDANNCELSDSVVIIADEYEVVVYNAFTPNADGVNDVWNIKYIDNFPEASVQIFNQWGAEVFSSNGYSEPWDGTMDGNELPAGTYYYIIKLGDDYKDKSGSVTIIK